MRRNYAREKSELHRKVRPLGTFVAEAARAKREGVLLPTMPRIQSQDSADTMPGLSVGHTDDRDGNRREAPVLRACLRWLHKQGIFAYRQNSGTAWINGQPVSFGYSGAADITGILPDGRRLEVECKSATGRQSEKQKKFQEAIERNNGVYLLVRSEKELICGILKHSSDGNSTMR